MADPLSTAAAAAKIVQIAQQQGWFGKLKDAFAEKRPVLVLGSTGVGKTNFLESLQSLVPETIDRLNRTSAAQQQKIKIDKEVFHFIDTPGQIGHQSRRSQAILGALGTPKLGVINLTCWGYHEYTHGEDEAVENGQPSESWLEKHRKVEIEALKEWGPMMGSKPEYFFTVVSKADLWWPQKDKVLRYYNDEDYGTLLTDFGIRNRSVFGYSSVRHPFYGIAPTSGNFDDDTRYKLQQYLLRELLRSATTR
ncbi:MULTISPECIES: GTPase domain-containing protein [unclassified Rhodococcus (in: high G+C Gram-positive bacteria)]|uniref:GTPase domain-containing protein n=1 Tax=unclassified Rhodococcus (in: high G+C Gram-positive bacteria) TaxID=192944 RepID=UPI0009FD4F96|nr:GTPase domain-containing protein [Rhodococcus sp. DK17]